jgi:hypothetical protein
MHHPLRSSLALLLVVAAAGCGTDGLHDHVEGDGGLADAGRLPGAPPPSPDGGPCERTTCAAACDASHETCVREGECEAWPADTDCDARCAGDAGAGGGCQPACLDAREACAAACSGPGAASCEASCDATFESCSRACAAGDCRLACIAAVVQCRECEGAHAVCADGCSLCGADAGGRQ